MPERGAVNNDGGDVPLTFDPPTVRLVQVYKHCLFLHQTR